MAINTRLNLFICLECQSAQTGAYILTHLTKKHSHLGITSDQRYNLDMLAKQADISKEFPDLSNATTVLEPFAGLAISPSLGCPHCLYSASAKPLSRHMTSCHPALPNGPVLDVWVQQLTKGGGAHGLLRVQEPHSVALETSSDNDLLNQIKDFDWHNHSSDGLPNARLISPWLLRTGWHHYIQGFDPVQLCDIAGVSKNDQEFPGLYDTVLEYFESATDLLDQTDELVLQKINSSDPDKE